MVYTLSVSGGGTNSSNIPDAKTNLQLNNTVNFSSVIASSNVIAANSQTDSVIVGNNNWKLNGVNASNIYVNGVSITTPSLANTVIEGTSTAYIANNQMHIFTANTEKWNIASNGATAISGEIHQGSNSFAVGSLFINNTPVVPEKGTDWGLLSDTATTSIDYGVLV